MVVNTLYYGEAPVPDGSPSGLKQEFTISPEVIAAALENIYRRDFNPTDDIEPAMFNAIAQTLTKAVNTAAPSLGNDPIVHALRHSADVFAAFKVHRAQNDMAARLLDSNGNLKPFEQWKKEVLPIASHQCGSWLRTEYNTAVLRARQAAAWQQFQQEKDVFPNLRWLPSTSPNPGADHRPFWNTVLPIDHPFWDEHRPGDRWNCKCDLTATDAPTTPVPKAPVPDRSLSGSNPQPGLTGNPGKSGALFSEDHPYFPSDCRRCPFYKPDIVGKMQNIFQNKKKDCYHCQYVLRCINKVEKKEENRKLYDRLSKDKRYKGVEFNPETGALKATHVGHNDGKGEGFVLEKKLVDLLYSCGYSIILCDEQKKGKNGEVLPSLDMILDGTYMDIKSITKNKAFYGSAIRSKNNQLARFSDRTDVHEKADTLCLYFDDPTMFAPEKITKGYDYMVSNTSKNIYIKHIICVINSAKGPEIKTFDFK